MAPARPALPPAPSRGPDITSMGAVLREAVPLSNSFLQKQARRVSAASLRKQTTHTHTPPLRCVEGAINTPPHPHHHPTKTLADIIVLKF